MLLDAINDAPEAMLSLVAESNQVKLAFDGPATNPMVVDVPLVTVVATGCSIMPGATCI